MSKYLEQNQRMLSEVGQNLRLKRGERVGDSHSVTFSSAGSFHSQELGREVFAGLKEQWEWQRDPHELKNRLICELATMQIIAQNMPHLLPELPLFYGLLTDKKGKPMAIVSEDFSETKKYEVEEDYKFPSDIEEALKEYDLGGHFMIANATFRVNGKRRIGDLYRVVMFDLDLPLEPIKKDIEKYTVKIDYSL